MNSNFKELEIGNSRLVYRKLNISDLNTVEVWKSVSSFVDRSPKLSMASSSSFIYFEQASELLEPNDSFALVGREIIGFCDSDFLEDFNLESRDFNSATIYSYEYNGGLEIDSLFAVERAIRRDNDYNSLWRVRFSNTDGQSIYLEFWKS